MDIKEILQNPIVRHLGSAVILAAAGYLAVYILAITLVFLALAAGFFALGRRMSGRRRILPPLIRLPGSFV